jgi:hypothetical protein
VRLAQAAKLARLRELRALRERLAFAERVTTRRIATTASQAARTAQTETEMITQAALSATKADFETLASGIAQSVRAVVSAHDAAQARLQDVESAQARQRAKEDVARAAVTDADRASAMHGQMRARVGGLDRLVSELQAQALRIADLVQDEAVGDLVRGEDDGLAGWDERAVDSR